MPQTRADSRSATIRKRAEGPSGPSSAGSLNTFREDDYQLRDIRKSVNRDDGKWLKIGNYDLNFIEIVGYFIFIGGILPLGIKSLAPFKLYGWGLTILGLIVAFLGNLKNRNDNKNV